MVETLPMVHTMNFIAYSSKCVQLNYEWFMAVYRRRLIAIYNEKKIELIFLSSIIKSFILMSSEAKRY